MTDFDHAYEVGNVVECYFGHGHPGDHGHPFATQTIVVEDVDTDNVVGSKASVNERATVFDEEDADRDPDTPKVQIRDKRLMIRKSAVVMKRDFGPVHDLHVTKAEPDVYETDDADTP